MLVLARSGSLNKMLSGDAPVAADGSTGGTADKRRRPSVSSVGTPPSSPAKVHNVSNGIYSTNRSGVRLCEDFQRGTCEGVDLNARCRANPDKVHQCNKCLAADHSGKDCTKSPRPPSSGSKGRGKGKKKGKGAGRRSQY